MGRGQGGGGGGTRLAGGGSIRTAGRQPNQLTASDIDDVQLYAGNINYQNINGLLNGTLEEKLRKEGTPKGLIDNIINKAKADVPKVDAVLDKFADYQGEVYRTLHFQNTDWSGMSAAGNAFVKAHGVGDTVQYPGFTSASKVKHTPYFSYNKDKASYNVRLKIQSKTGKDVSAYSQKKAEQEVTFRRNTQFRVVSKTQRSNGGWDITLREL